MTAMVTLEGVAKRYAARGTATAVSALDGIDLTVEAGEIYGIIGRSGAGKSTLVRCINLLERPTQGRVTVAGVDMMALDRAGLIAGRRRMGMVFQHFNLLSSRSVFDNVALPLELAGVGRAERRRRVAPLLDMVGLADKADRYPSELSGGQKQRVGIARALSNSPELLLCDEITSALDPETTQQILSLIVDLKQRLGLTVVAITHEMGVIREICDRVAVMEAGRIIEQGPVYDVFTDPKHATTRSFVSSEVDLAIPSGLKRRFDAGAALPAGAGRNAVVRIVFKGDAAFEPAIARLATDRGISVNILHGRIEYIQGRPFGLMLVEVPGGEARGATVVDFINGLGLDARITDHVPVV
ncbi:MULTISPECIES: methionine ABC transporter ATP-binding protein [Tistrella]|uniref:Methionine ABC transporter ATP-binding protein n=1 Tax=Tistrella arctica TaxID=3133430 RepID=A0ABU9YRZ5_9PROT